MMKQCRAAGIIPTAAIILAAALGSVNSEILLDESRSTVAPRQIILNEVSPEQAKAREAADKEDRERRRTQALLSSAGSANKIYTNEAGINFAGPDWLLNLRADDPVSGVRRIEYRINNGPVFIYERPIQLPGEGLKSVRYRSFDRAGNLESEKIFTVIIDPVPPEVRILQGENDSCPGDVCYVKPDIRFFVEAQDKYSGIESVLANVDSRGFAPANQDGYIFGDAGIHLLQALAIDHIGNRSETKTNRIVVDANAPEVFIRPTKVVPIINGSNVCSLDTSLVISAVDDLSGVRRIMYRTGPDGPWLRYTSPVYVSGDGIEIKVRAVDRSGNESPVKSFSCILDSRPPGSGIRTGP